MAKRPVGKRCQTASFCRFVPQPLVSPLLAEGTPRLGLVALIRPGLAPGRCFHLLGQLLRAAGRDNRPLATDRDPHAFQRIKQDAHRGNLARSLRMSSAAWTLPSGMASPLVAESHPFPQHRTGEPGPLGNARSPSAPTRASCGRSSHHSAIAGHLWRKSGIFGPFCSYCPWDLRCWLIPPASRIGGPRRLGRTCRSLAGCWPIPRRRFPGVRGPGARAYPRAWRGGTRYCGEARGMGSGNFLI